MADAARMVAALVCALETFAALFAVAGERVFDDRIGLLSGRDGIDFHRLAFQLLVVEKEAPQHRQAMLWQLGGLAVGVELWVLGGDRDDLMVFLAASIMVIRPMARA